MTEIVGINIAVLVVTISIILSGIILGLGRAISIKRIELFGVEELIQSIINAALVGGIFVIIEVAQTISKEMTLSSCSAESMISAVSCSFQAASGSLNALSGEIIKLSLLIGNYQSIVLNFNILEIQPLQNLSLVSNLFSANLIFSNILLIFLDFNLMLLNFFEQNALFLFLPLGLVLRSFFATRKIGGFLIALSIGLYLFYPAFIMAFPTPEPELLNATEAIILITNNSNYIVPPIVDMNDNYVIAQKIDQLSQNDFTGDLTIAHSKTSLALSKTMLSCVFAPLFSFIITIIFIKGFGDILSGPISFSLGVV
ncbi:MAG: hypothetical protein WC501_00115 [Candidatus Micrarchaeia archaeon]